jgi:hypothetical protein
VVLRGDLFFFYNNLLYFAIGGGYESGGYYRLSDGSLISDFDAFNTDFQYIDVDFAGGFYKIFDLSRHLYNSFIINILALYKLRYVQYMENESLLFQSSLYEKNRFIQHSILIGASIEDMLREKNYFIPVKGYNFEISYQIYTISFDENSKLYNRINLNARLFYPVIKKSYLITYIGEYFIFDYLWGEYIPFDATSSFGGFKPSSGLGSRIRGLLKYYDDGYIKISNNFDLRILFPRLINQYFIPGIILFFDTGLSSGLSYDINFDKTIYTTGAGILFKIVFVDIITYFYYNISSGEYSYIIEFGTHF